MWPSLVSRQLRNCSKDREITINFSKAYDKIPLVMISCLGCISMSLTIKSPQTALPELFSCLWHNKSTAPKSEAVARWYKQRRMCSNVPNTQFIKHNPVETPQHLCSFLCSMLAQVVPAGPPQRCVEYTLSLSSALLPAHCLSHLLSLFLHAFIVRLCFFFLWSRLSSRHQCGRLRRALRVSSLSKPLAH